MNVTNTVTKLLAYLQTAYPTTEGRHHGIHLSDDGILSLTIWTETEDLVTWSDISTDGLGDDLAMDPGELVAILIELGFPPPVK